MGCSATIFTTTLNAAKPTSTQECGQRPPTSRRFSTEPRLKMSRPKRSRTSGETNPRITPLLCKTLPNYSNTLIFTDNAVLTNCDNFDTVLQQVLRVDCFPVIPPPPHYC